MAAYLRGEAEAKPASEKILERLTSPQPAPAATASTTPPVETVDQKKLDALTKAAEPTLPAGGPSPAPEEKPVDLAKADEKLSSLLNKPK